MKNILCYGDSLTWGAIPNGDRHPYEDRWPSALGAALGTDKVRIIAEGLGGRHTIYDEFSLFADKNGARILPTLLATHQPLDCVIIMLGTNDMKPHIAGTASAAASGISRLAEIVTQFPYWGDYRVPGLVLVAPPHCVPTDHGELGPMFAGAPQESKKLAAHYQRVASEFDAVFFDAAKIATASPIDGVHLDAQNTIAIGKGLAPVVGKLLKL